MTEHSFPVKLLNTISAVRQGFISEGDAFDQIVTLFEEALPELAKEIWRKVKEDKDG